MANPSQPQAKRVYTSSYRRAIRCVNRVEVVFLDEKYCISDSECSASSVRIFQTDRLMP
jgi:hypothetical protein